jgi:hypothetical protein
MQLKKGYIGNFVLDPYPITLFFVIGTYEKNRFVTEMKKCFKKKFLKQGRNFIEEAWREFDKNKSADGVAIEFEDSFNDTRLMIVVYSYKDVDEALGTLVHEISHIVDSASVKIGMPLNMSTTEPRAYLAGYIFRKLSVYIK